MRMRGLSIVVALTLAGCGGNAPATDAEQSSPAASPSVAAVEVPVAGPERRVLAFGDSLFAGYRLNPAQAYPVRLEAALRKQGVNARVTNAGVSGDTTAAGRQRFTFILQQQSRAPDLVIVELGGNDLLRGIPPAETRKNLEAMLDELKKRQIPVLLMGMRAPPNMGADYVAAFDGIYPALAEKYGAPLVPFFLEAIYDKPALIQADRIHPTAVGVDELVGATLDDVTGALSKSG